MGAVFSGGGAVVSYDDGVQAAASGTTGTQRNEFTAAIKSVTSSTTVGAVFLYDTSQDSDGGKWRSKCKGLSWFDEASSTTRSARSEFPAMALIVADNESGAETVTIYDLDDVAAPVWMVFSNTGSLTWATSGSVTIESVYALNGRIYVGHEQGSVGFIEYNFPGDDSRLGNSTAYQLTSGRTIAERNTTSSWATGGDGYVIVNAVVNDVAATVLEGAEIGALGLPIPTVCVSTANGNSIIHPNGDVFDLSDGASSRAYSGCRFRENGDLFTWSTQNGSAQSWYRSQFYSDATSGFWKYAAGDDANLPHPLADSSQVIEVGGDSVFTGGDNGLSIINENLANPAEGMVSHITSTYNTGYMVGDIRFAGLAGSGESGDITADRSVKAHTLTKEGTGITDPVVATNAELRGIEGFSASSYLSKAYHADFDFGTGDFSVMFWAKDSNAAESQNFASRSDASGLVDGDWLMQSQSDGSIDFYRHSGSGWVLDASTTSPATPRSTATGAIVANQWTQVVAVKRSSKFYWYINGELSGTPQADANSFTSNSALTIGHSLGNSGPADNSSLSLLRISATAPTPKQIADIYAAEKPLFAAGAACLLQSDDSSPNIVNGLAYDKTTGLLSASQWGIEVGRTDFRGLEAVNTFNGKDHGWTAAATQKLAAAGGVIAGTRTSAVGGVLVDLPALDVRAELNEGESKIPDDGKLHFSASILGATATNIAHIPVNENEAVFVSANVRANEYGGNGERAFYQLKSIYRQDIGGNIVLDDEISTLGSETTASMVAKFDSNTPKGAIEIEVTGVALKQIVWKAEVEVQRISDKTYER
jgi:hypothetical protein